MDPDSDDPEFARLLVDHRARLVRMRVVLYNDLVWHLHDLWPEARSAELRVALYRIQAGAGARPRRVPAPELDEEEAPGGGRSEPVPLLHS